MTVTNSHHENKHGHLKHPKYRADIDGLRAIAVLAVVGFHAFPSWVKGGFIGVDVFFVISGFLISTIIFENLECRRFSFIEFYSRRIKRIFPALVLVLIVCYGIGWVSLFADEYKQLGKHIVGGAGFISNFLFWSENGYFDNAAATKPLLHLWSLGIEEQFYIIWPFFLWISWQMRQHLLLVTIVIAVISFALNISQVSTDNVAAFYSPQTRFWELLAGSILAYFSLSREIKNPPFQKQSVTWMISIIQVCAVRKIHKGIFCNTLSFAGVLLVAAGFLVISHDEIFPGWLVLLPVSGTVLIVLAGSKAWFNRYLLSNRLLVWIGLISFPLYLWHWPLLSFTRIIQSQDLSHGLRIAIIALSFFLAWLTFRLVEVPFRFGHKNRVKTIILLFAMGFAGMAGYDIYRNDGLPGRTVVQINPSIYTGDDGGVEGHFVYGCGISNAEDQKLFGTCGQDDRETPKYALLGDSKAAALYTGLIRTSTEGGRWLVIGGNGPHGAPVPVLSDSNLYSSYQKLTNIAVDSLIKNKSIETVVFMTATRVLFLLKNTHSIEDLPSSKYYDAALDGLINTAGKLISAGKKIVLIVDNPTLPDPMDCLGRTTSLGLLNKVILKPSSARCSLQLDRHIELSKLYRDVLLEVQSKYPDDIKIFDTTQYLCDVEQGVCLSHKKGRFLYRYSDHISDYAAGLIGQDLNLLLNNEYL